MAAKSDYYDILGVTKGAPADEIKKAYRKQALEWHPDRHQGADKEAAEKRFKEINEAYQVLSDSQKKAAYDQYGHEAFSPGGGFRGGNPFAGGNPFGGGRSGPFTYTYQTSGGGSPFEGMDFGDPFDIFESFFGGGFNRGQQRKQIPRYSITLDFMEAVNGVEKEVSIEGKKRTIKIPAGVDSGQRIQFQDFILSIDVQPHELFERDSQDIYIKVAIPFSLATLGGQIKVPTVDEEVELRIRPGTQSGTMLRLKGKGVTAVHGKQKGDEYVKINVATPEKLSREQKRLIEELQEKGL